MKYQTISPERVVNLGNYNTERLEVLAQVTEDEDIDQAIESLKATVLKGLKIESEAEPF